MGFETNTVCFAQAYQGVEMIKNTKLNIVTKESFYFLRGGPRETMLETGGV